MHGPLDDWQLLQLRENLSTGLPKSNGLRVCVQNVLKSRVKGKFYVDQWPGFAAVVFQCVQPSISSTGDLHCYTSSGSLESKQKLVILLEHSGLISTNMWRFLSIVEDEEESVAQYLVNNVRVGGRHLTSEEYTIEKSGFYVMLRPSSKKAECPAGYALDKLTKEHMKHILAQDGLLINSFTTRPTSVVLEYTEHCLQSLETVAVFQCGDASTPVAGAMCHAFNGECGSLFTSDRHRRKGLASAIIREISEYFFSEGDMPFATVSDDSASMNLHLKSGFVRVGTFSEMRLNISA